VSGFKVFPNEVEDVVAMHPGVLEAAVIGVPDERTGQAVKLFVVRRDPELNEAAMSRRISQPAKFQTSPELPEPAPEQA
jgi:acyl-CoA synthetase (AMP-forming)/AMP-acid ligase II